MPENEKTPETQLLSNVRGIIAEYERAKILERTARGRRGRAQAGYVPGGMCAFGYRYVKHDDKGAHYEPHPEEAALVQRIFHLYVEQGMSQYGIAALLTREGVVVPQDARPAVARTLTVPVWHQSTISGMLRNKTYIGQFHYGKTSRRPGKSDPDKHTRHEATPEETWIPLAVPPLVSAALFAAAQARLESSNQTNPRNRKYDYLLVAGRLRCGQCGCAMLGKHNKGRQPRYHCTRACRPYTDVITAHTVRSVLVSAVDLPVWQAVLRVLNNPELIAHEVKQQQEGTSGERAMLAQDRQPYDRQVVQCAKDLARWEAAYVGEVITLDDFKAKKAEVDARRASAEHELARLDTLEQHVEARMVETQSLLNYCAHVQAQLHDFSVDEQRRALQALNITVTWHPDRPLRLQGNIPVDIQTSAPRCRRRRRTALFRVG